MDALLEKLSAGQIIALVSIISGAIVVLAMIIAITKYQFQALAEDTALKREKQEADLSLRARLIESREASGEKASVVDLLALGANQSEPDELDTELAKRFGQLDTSAEEIERALKRALASDRSHKKMILAVMNELLEAGVEPEAVLAAVRPLCGQTTASRKEPVSASA
jgi:hypothetical protein